MKKISICLVIFTTAIFFASNSFSQGSFSVHVGTAIPLSDFGDDDLDSEDGGGAAIGFNMGGKYQYTLNESGLGLYVAANLNYNGLKKNLKDDIQALYDDMAGTDVDINFTKYLNIPITAGLYYAYKANESVSLFGELGLGVDFLKATDMKMEANGGEIKLKHKSKAQFAFEFGGGLIIQDKYIFDLHYCGLGKHDLSTKIEYDGGSGDIGNSDLKVSLVTISLGYRF
jgi:opacity protein-like surface antigen